MIIGTVKGPGKVANDYLFITTDNEHARVGEFVFYKACGREILGTITGCRLARMLPDGLLADPETPPQIITDLLGMEAGCELYEVNVSTIGYFDEALRDFVNPRVPPIPGQSVWLASDQMLELVLNPCRPGQPGAAQIGSLLSRPEGRVPIVVSVKEIASTHLAILASTGAGKSYAAGVLVEEMLRPNNRAAILIVDPHGEYGTLKDLEAIPELCEGSYAPKVKILLPDRVRVRFNTLKFSDIRYLLPEMTDKQSYYLSRGFQELQSRRTYGFRDLYEAMLQLKYEDSEQRTLAASTIEAVCWKLEYRFRSSKVFSDVEHNHLTELFQPGQCTVLQLNEIDQHEQQVIVGTLLRRISDARIGWVTQRNLAANPEDQLPFPVFILLEEAHRFAPATANVVSTDILRQILSEGRKFGIGVGLITQRPGKLDQDVLSQCQTQFILRIVNPIDQKTIASSIESVGRSTLDELPALSKGQLIVAGVAINVPVLCRVRQRLTRHGGQTIDAPQEWAKWYSESVQRELERSRSVLLKPEGRRVQYDGIDV
ncbi:MAG: ATP-binding protein [Acidobacteriota bacterium]|nr:ATP-binding protein [Blastocatellia bacterium]MDW8411711.1 ATP-binding protein [Acidobacteriota bacterium]